MAHDKLAIPSNSDSHLLGNYLVWLQGSMWYLRAIDGDRSNVWENDWNHGESFISVCAYVVYTENSVTDRTPTLSAYPTSGIFAVCQPDVPCITPGTYAFLGAAAALR